MLGVRALDSKTRWLHWQPEGGRLSARLICFPHAGGGANVFRSWNRALPSSVQVCSLLLPGRETRFAEPNFKAFDPLLDTLFDELMPVLDMPYVVYGHSMGALLAFEWVRRLQSAGHRMPQHLFLSGRRAPHLPDTAGLMRMLPDREFVNELTRRYEGISADFLQEPELLQLFLPMLRADISVVESYVYRNGDQLSCPLTVAAGVHDSSVSYDQLLAWKRYTQSSFTARLYPGGHFYPQGLLLKAITAAFSEIPAASLVG